MSGEVAAAKARAVYAGRHGGPQYSGSVTRAAGKANRAPEAVPGQDGYILDIDDVTSSVPALQGGTTATIDSPMPSRSSSARATGVGDRLSAH